MKEDFINIINDITSKFTKIKQSEYKLYGNYRIIDQGSNDIAGYTNNNSFVNNDDVPVIIFGDHTKVFKFIDLPIAIGADGVKVLKVNNEKADTKYIYYYLKSIKLPDAGYSRHFKYLKQSKIFLPPLEDQIRIATILSRIEGLIVKRKESIRLLDEFVKSAFLEMFGDPELNNKGWELREINEVCNDIYRYPTFYGFNYVEEGVPVVKIGNILPNGLVDPDLNNYSYITEEINQKYPRTMLKLNDILMAVRGDGSTVKRIGLVISSKLVGANISPNLLRFNSNNEIILPIYLFILMTSENGQKMLGKYINKTAKKTITAADLKKIKIPVPPIIIQNKFVSIVKKIEAVKAKYQDSLSEFEKLYGSVSQRAFRGEM